MECGKGLSIDVSHYVFQKQSIMEHDGRIVDQTMAVSPAGGHQRARLCRPS